jgi:photosystem II stability/assembly factor-like uncharacterized protein
MQPSVPSGTVADRPGLWATSALTLALAACSGGGGGPMGGGSSGGSSGGTGLSVTNLHADKSQTSLGVPVTFSVQCSAAAGGGTFTYQWHYGDESDPSAVTDTTVAPTTTHTYVLPAHAPVLNNYDSYAYTVTCMNSAMPMASAKAEAQTIKVLREDLALSTQQCSSGARGLGWCYQSPLPTGEVLMAVVAVSDQVAWTVGQFGTVLRTEDGGTTWLPLYLGGVAVRLPTLMAVGATDPNHAWIAGVDGEFWSTADGGASWARGKPAAALRLIGVTAPDSSHAYGVDGSATVYATANGGGSWHSLAVPGLAAGSQLLAIGALDAQNVFVAGRSLTAFEMESADAGVHWSPSLTLVDGAGLGTNPQSLAVTRGSRCGNADLAATQDTVWVAGWANAPQNNPVPVTYNWARGAASAGPQHAGGVTLGAFDGRTAWLSPISGATILTTQDGLQSLASTPSPFPAEEALNGFDSVDCRTGWAVGSYGEIGLSTDGGATWTAQSSKSPLDPNFVSGAALSAMSAVALGTSPVGTTSQVTLRVFATSDGLTWQEQHSDTAGYVNSAESPFIVADAAGDMVLGTETYLAIFTNGTWSANLVPNPVAPPDPNFVSFVAASISGRTAWILEAAQGQVLLDDLSVNPDYASIPRGTIPPNPASLPRAIAAVDATHAVVVGDGGVIQLVAYDAPTWQWTSVSSGTSEGLTAISLGSSGGGAALSGWAVGAAGTVLRTTDGGKTWAAQTWPVAQVFDTDLTSVSTLDGIEGWVGGNQVMMHTTDGGLHWTFTDMTVFYARVAAAGPYAAWAIGPGSFIRKTLTGGVVPPSQ